MEPQVTAPVTPEPQNPVPPVLPPSKPRLPSMVIVVVVLLLASSVSSGIYWWSRTRTQTPPVANQNPTSSSAPEIFSLKASVQYLTGSAWKLLDGRKTEIREKDVLSENDVLMTDPKSRLVLTLDDGSVVRLDENTTLALSEIKSEKISLNNQTGTIFARVQKDPLHKFIIVAKNVTVESAGTAFLVENMDEVKVLVYESAVRVSTSSGQLSEIKKEEQWSESHTTPKKIDSKNLASREFAEWSLKAENVAPSPTVTATPTKKPESASGITLVGKTSDSGILLEWKISGIDTPNGVKVVKSDIPNPVYPGSEFAYLPDPAARSYTWSIKDGRQWHFRVCRYTDGACGIYSNDVLVNAPSGGKASDSGESHVSKISLTAVKNESGKVILEWSPTGTSALGFKTVWSRNSDPTYPTRDGDQFHYLSDPSARRDEITGLESGKTYYFRVCEYLGGSCGTYSNQISLPL